MKENIGPICESAWRAINTPLASWKDTDLAGIGKKIQAARTIPDYMVRLNACLKGQKYHLVYWNKSFTKKDRGSLKKTGIDPKNIDLLFEQQNESPLRYQDDAVRFKMVRTICPFTGNLIGTKKSFFVFKPVLTIFYRFESVNVFYLGAFALPLGLPLSFIFFPALNMVIIKRSNAYPVLKTPTISNHIKKRLIRLYRFFIKPVSGHKMILNAILGLKSTVLGRFSDCADYIKNIDDTKTALLIGGGHFAHHAWNELSALQRLADNNLIQEIEQLFVFSESLGPIHEIFPEINPGKIKKTGNDQLIDMVLSDNILLVPVGDKTMNKVLRDRILGLACRMADPDLKKNMSRFCEKRFPVLWITIKPDSRTMTNQAAAIENVLFEIQKRHKALAVIFDGFSLPYKQRAGQTDAERKHIEKVNVLLSRVRDKLAERHIPSITLSGKPLCDALFAAQYADIYLSHAGTIQHKIGWFSEASGIVHSNWYTLISSDRTKDSNNLGRLSYLPLYSCWTFIKKQHGNIAMDRTNYHLYWRVAAKKLLTLLDSPTHPPLHHPLLHPHTRRRSC